MPTNTGLSPSEQVLPAKPSGYLPTLDGWRAISIFAVIACHGGTIFGKDGAYPSAAGFWLASHGLLGVDVFFGISGLLICSRILEEKQKRGALSLKGFYIRRAFRILPPAYFYLVVLAGLGSLHLVQLRLDAWLGAALFFRNYVPDLGVSGFTGHFWSLAVEEHFYFIFPLLAAFLPRRPLLWILASMALAVALWRGLDAHFHLMDKVLANIAFDKRTDTRSDGILWGAWLAVLISDPMWNSRARALLNPAVWSAALLVLLCVMFLPIPGFRTMLAFLIPVVLLGTTQHPKWFVSRMLEWAPIRWIGRLSYSIYLWQSLFLVPVASERRMGAFQAFPVELFAVFGCAAFSYYVIERPFVRIGHRLARPATPGRADMKS